MNMEAGDMELLRDYVCNHSDQAFRTLVERHIDLVYSIALRQTQQPQQAEDATQAVFIVLAEKASTISRNTILAGWLFRATRYALRTSAAPKLAANIGSNKLHRAREFERAKFRIVFQFRARAAGRFNHDMKRPCL